MARGDLFSVDLEPFMMQRHVTLLSSLNCKPLCMPLMSLLLAGNAFVIFTDHCPLVTICNKRRLDEVENTRILRSLIKLMDNNQFTVEYIPDTQIKIVDILLQHSADSPASNKIDSLNSQQFPINTTRLVQAEKAECSFCLQRLQDVAAEDLEYQLLKNQILQGFPAEKSKLPQALCPYWNVRDDLLISEDRFILKKLDL